jgi:hypothetical protein
MASMTANWLSMSGQGCLPLSISSTVQPSDQMSALRPAAQDKVTHFLLDGMEWTIE